MLPHLARLAGAPTGIPLIIQLGSGSENPNVVGSLIHDGGRWLEHCVFDEGTYRNPDARQQHRGRSILAARDAVVLIPRQPLRPGTSYRVIIEVNHRRIDWTFGVAGV